jgi:nitrogen fixation/metabolism regulation signal transduction histidine kinase
LKAFKKDYNTEDKERYRPLLNVKRELKEFVDEIEKDEKKNDIAIKKEFNAISQ